MQRPAASQRKRAPGAAAAPLPPAATLVARHYLTELAVRVAWRDGRITELEPLDEDPATDYWIAPGLVDLQVNGYGGVDFQSETITPEAAAAGIRELHRAGCTRCLVTLVTDEWERFLAKLRHWRELRAGSAALRTAIAGWHLEGPFLSAEPGFCGAHAAEFMVDPTPARIRALRKAAGDDLVLLTLAPERPGALEAVALAVSLGMRVSLGHTNASAAEIALAMQAGATGFTHLGNGCPQGLDRHDNILWRIFETDGLTVSLIPDGVHVSPSLFRLAHRLLPSEDLFYVTDAMAAAGAAPGLHQLGALQLEVGPDGVVRLPGQSYFAGSALRPVDGVWRAAALAETSWQTAWRRFSQRPAEWFGLPCGLGVGQAADFCLIPYPAGASAPPLRVFLGGQELR